MKERFEMMFSEKSFEDYCFKFYGPNEMYGNFFDNTLTREELRLAIQLRLSNRKLEFAGDSFDREIVRDILLAVRGEKTEYDVSVYMKGSSEES
jgi:hypothetical protein